MINTQLKTCPVFEQPWVTIVIPTTQNTEVWGDADARHLRQWRHQPSESRDSSSTHNFRGGDCGENKRSVSADAHTFIPNYLLGVDLFNSQRAIEGQEPKRF